MTRRVLVLGSGKRVREAVLPALRRLEADFELDGVMARTVKTIESEGRPVDVETLDSLDAARFAGVELVVMAVAKVAVPSVLARLGGLGAGSTDLLIDTPVLLYKHLGHLARLDAFRNVWVAEDCSTLPCFDPLRAALDADAIGPLRRVTLHRSAYAYHGLAMAKTIVGPSRIVRGRRKHAGDDRWRRDVTFANGVELVVQEPRDYRVGRILVEGERGAISDEGRGGDALPWSALVENGACRGFRVGPHESRLDARDRELIGEPLDGAEEPPGVTAWIEGMKRVGLVRLLERIRDGRGGYPLAEGVDDTVVDYHLEKFGRYVSNPFTHPRGAPARVLLKALTRVAGR